MGPQLPPATEHVGRRLPRPFAILVAIAAVVLLLGACSGSASAPLPAGNTTMDSKVTGEGALAPAMPAASAAPSAAPAAGSGRDVSSQAYSPDTPQIIRTGTLTLEVADIDKALQGAQAAVSGVGGYVSASQRSNKGDQSAATVTFRIPAARWDDALAALHRIGTKVVDEQTSAVEVTGQVLDLGARIANLRATETALQGIMAKATKIPDVLAVEQQLSDVQGQIEQLSTQKQHLQDQAALGTLTVYFGLHTVAVAQVTNDWNPAGEVDRAVASIVGIGQSLVVAGVWFVIVWLPVLVGLALVSLIGWLVLRRTGLTRRIRPPEAGLPVHPEA